MRFASDPSDRRTSRRRFQIRPGQGRMEFRRLRDQRWNKLAFWRYLILLILVILLLKYLLSLASGP